MQRRILIIIRRPAKRDTVSLRRSSLNINNPDDACDTAKFLATLDIAMELIERALFWAVIAVYGLGGVAVVAGFALCALTMEKADITEYFASLASRRQASSPAPAHLAWQEFLAHPKAPPTHLTWVGGHFQS